MKCGAVHAFHCASKLAFTLAVAQLEMADGEATLEVDAEVILSCKIFVQATVEPLVSQKLPPNALEQETSWALAQTPARRMTLVVRAVVG